MLDDTYDCEFVFGDEPLNIKKFDLSLLKKANVTHVGSLGHFVTQWGIIPYIFNVFDYYILTIETNNLSHWLLLLLAKLFKKKKIFIWCHGLYGYENYLQGIIRKIYFSLSDGIFLYSNYARELMIRKGYKAQMLYVIHNSLNYDEQLKIRHEINKSNIFSNHFGNHNPVLLFIGRLTEVKKLDMLVNALRLLHIKGEKYNLVFVGDGEKLEILQKLVGDYELTEYVWFYGSCYNEELNAELIFNSDLCVSPGNVGLTSIHSLMFGTPVLTHNDYTKQMPECEAIVDGNTGAFFDYNSVESLVDSISQWFSSHQNQRDIIRQKCFDIIDREWNPYYQMTVFKSVFGE